MSIAACRYPPPFPLKSRMILAALSLSNFSAASSNSLEVVAENLEIFIVLFAVVGQHLTL